MQSQALKFKIVQFANEYSGVWKSDLVIYTTRLSISKGSISFRNAVRTKNGDTRSVCFYNVYSIRQQIRHLVDTAVAGCGLDAKQMG